MKRELLLLFFIIAINLFFGYLFQVKNGVICFTELSFIGLGALLFWILLYRPLKRFTLGLIEKDEILPQTILKIGGVGIVSSIANLFFCQLFLILSFTLIFQCESPAFSTLNASLTNNIAGNLLCYAALIGLVVYDNSQVKLMESQLSKQEILDVVAKENRNFLMLSNHKGMEKVIFEEISHIQVNQNCITIYTGKKKFVKYQSLQAFLKELPSNKFRRIHRSTVVNMDFVLEIRPNQYGDGEVILTNQVTLKYSRSYKQALRES